MRHGARRDSGWSEATHALHRMHRADVVYCGECGNGKFKSRSTSVHPWRTGLYTRSLGKRSRYRATSFAGSCPVEAWVALIGEAVRPGKLRRDGHRRTLYLAVGRDELRALDLVSAKVYVWSGIYSGRVVSPRTALVVFRALLTL